MSEGVAAQVCRLAPSTPSIHSFLLKARTPILNVDRKLRAKATGNLLAAFEWEHAVRYRRRSSVPWRTGAIM